MEFLSKLSKKGLAIILTGGLLAGAPANAKRFDFEALREDLCDFGKNVSGKLRSKFTGLQKEALNFGATGFKAFKEDLCALKKNVSGKFRSKLTKSQKKYFTTDAIWFKALKEDLCALRENVSQLPSKFTQLTDSQKKCFAIGATGAITVFSMRTAAGRRFLTTVGLGGAGGFLGCEWIRNRDLRNRVALISEQLELVREQAKQNSGKLGNITGVVTANGVRLDDLSKQMLENPQKYSNYEPKNSGTKKTNFLANLAKNAKKKTKEKLEKFENWKKNFSNNDNNDKSNR